MNVNYLTLSVTLGIAGLIFFAPRRYVIVLFLAAACYLPLFASLDVGGLNMSMIRIIIFFSWCRFLVRREFRLIEFNKIDIAVFAFLVLSIVTYTLLYGTADALINRFGMAYDVAGAYFMFRILFQGMDDVIRSFKILAILVVPIAIAMVVERITESNVFAIFGSPVALEGYVRGDRIRCFGPFSHPILAGSFGATTLAFFIGLWLNQHRKLAIIGIISSSLIILTSNSSGPAMSALAVMIGFSMWPMRNHMRAIRMSLLSFLVMAYLIMKAPVWFLIGKLGHVVGGSGWHRSEIIDAAIRHLDEWWLLGTNVTRHWMPTGVTWSEEHTDITNQFIRVGVDGGLITLIFFIYLLVTCFSALGKALKSTSEEHIHKKYTIWALGVTLFAHIVTFFSVRYFDQNVLFFYMLIAVTAIVHRTSDTESSDGIIRQ